MYSVFLAAHAAQMTAHSVQLTAHQLSIFMATNVDFNAFQAKWKNFTDHLPGLVRVILAVGVASTLFENHRGGIPEKLLISAALAVVISATGALGSANPGDVIVGFFATLLGAGFGTFVGISGAMMVKHPGFLWDLVGVTLILSAGFLGGT